jgi:tRNA threonylcarbamoyladenosine biosynthesis protein TsaE
MMDHLTDQRSAPVESRIINIDNEDQTRTIARQLAAEVQPGDIIALIGDLGAGKTTFTRYLVHALGVPEHVPVTSPTFTLQNIYTGGRVAVVHMDMYRISDLDEVEALGMEEVLEAESLLLVEWADRAIEALGDDILIIDLQVKSEEQRTMTLTPTGPAAADLLSTLPA